MKGLLRIRNIKLFLTLFVIGMPVLLLVNSCTWDKGELPEDPLPLSFCDSLTATYSGMIEPLIISNCALSTCHDAGSPNGDFTIYAGVKLKVDAGVKGTLKERVFDGSPSWMPPLPTGQLPQEERDMIECWLNEGAPNN